MRRRIVLITSFVAAAALPGAALADVFVEVPTPLLGGPIWKPIAIAPTPEPAGRPSLAPPATSNICLPGTPDCLVVGPGAESEPAASPIIDPPVDEDDTPQSAASDGTLQSLARTPRRAAPAAAPPDPEREASFGRLVSPRPADWLAWQRPVLAWQETPGADYYNVQIFRGSRRVMNAWSTATRLRVPDGVLRQGRSYVWVVWPGSGPRKAASYGPAVGRSSFAITLRPRIVFRRSGDGVVGELRPRIPFASLRLYQPSPSTRAARRVVTVNARSLVRLPISRRAAERLGALLVDRGPTPPVGLRGPG